MDDLLHFGKEWFELGMLTPSCLEQLEAEYQSSDDKNTEHYRYRVFTEFVKSKRPFDSRTAKALYELGDKDPDSQMGGSIMADVLRLEECPEELFELALNSDRKHLVKIAREKRDRGGLQMKTAPNNRVQRSRRSES